MADEVLDSVVQLLRDTLAIGEEKEIAPHHLLFYDLEFSSMDLLDLLFRVEDHFGISLEDGTFQEIARGELPAEAFAEGGYLKEEGRRRLMQLLEDSPPEIFPERIHVDTLPRFCTVGAIARLVRFRQGGR